MIPPLAEKLRPELHVSAEPLPLAPDPVLTMRLPPRPADAGPLPTTRDPELPTCEDPELKARYPLRPQTPEFALTMHILPLLVAVPSPDHNSVFPPL